MRGLVVEHAGHEGAGILGEELGAGGVSLDVVRTWAGDPLRAHDEYDLVVVLGGPQSANDAALRREAELLAAASRAGKFTVGICLGARLLARGLGAAVTTGPAPEIGLYPLSLTDAGRDEPLVAALDGAPMFHWHADTFALPAGAVLLASSARYRHQAFRVGTRTFAIQFHPECDRAMRVDWAARGGIDPATVAGDDALDTRGRAFARALLNAVRVREQV